METLHEPTVHVSKKQKLRQRGNERQKSQCRAKQRLSEFNKKYGDLELGQCWIEGDGDFNRLQISFLCADDDEVALLIPKLNQLINDNKEELRKQQQELKTYNDVYDSVYSTNAPSGTDST